MFEQISSDVSNLALTRRTTNAMAALIAAVAGIAIAPPALGDPDTGPRAQLAPWRAPAAAGGAFDPLNSVVEINWGVAGGTRIGTGSIISKHNDADPNFAWYCVLTADHVANPAGTIGNAVIGFGDTGAQGVFGGADNIIRRAPLPAAMGGMGAPVDLAVIGVRVPKNAFFDQVSPLAMLPTTQAQATNQQFTQPGYGGTGDFVAADPMNALPAGMTTAGPDHTKRFQNNVITGPTNANYNAGGVAYAYGSIQWSFDMPAAPGAHGAAHNFLVAEGTSYGGDSGSPYLVSQMSTQFVGNFDRPGAGSDWDFGPMHAGDDMPLFTNVIIGVHAWGVTPAGGFPGGVVPYGRLAGGVPLTQANIDWITAQCAIVPAPGSGILLAFGGILAAKRRRG
ncbi:MAG: hypothetical protein KDA05_01670 [Phycisphaerales bacterium]|nr:hypothetical protein [Phycisphaerales bacterium]MCB9840780.1 hypothetical protein [Phycisphaeraceae bacterium]